MHVNSILIKNEKQKNGYYLQKVHTWKRWFTHNWLPTNGYSSRGIRLTCNSGSTVHFQLWYKVLRTGGRVRVGRTMTSVGFYRTEWTRLNLRNLNLTTETIYHVDYDLDVKYICQLKLHKYFRKKRSKL